jgi:hypothetical protein
MALEAFFQHSSKKSTAWLVGIELRDVIIQMIHYLFNVITHRMPKIGHYRVTRSSAGHPVTEGKFDRPVDENTLLPPNG